MIRHTMYKCEFVVDIVVELPQMPEDDLSSAMGVGGRRTS